MNNHFILTPYFLDEPVSGLLSIAKSDWELNEPTLTGEDKQQRMTLIHQPLATAVSNTIQSGKRPVSIAGDCCTTIGVVAGLQQTGINPTLIWFDAHGDFNTWETTPSKFLGGMPLAMLVGKGEMTMMNGVQANPLPENQVILTDGRDLDPGEKVLVDESNVLHVTDPVKLLEMPLPDGPLYIHFDADILDPADAPAMNYPAPGGPSPKVMQQVFEHLAKSGQVAAISVSAWNPEMEGNGRSQTLILDLLKTLYQ
ncbi:MAG: arginase [Chloroflexi bacterium]|nr:MAG: arginase [Chloroflexota bacterium]